MGFIPISINKYVRMHLKNNPSENELDLRKSLYSAFADYQKGIKCRCGNEIWVIGSAVAGRGCFTCITGESYPSGDYEVDSALKNVNGEDGRRHINYIPPEKINGFFDDDGYEIKPELIQKPGLCLTCMLDDNSHEEILCQMTRYDQSNEKEFQCFAYRKKKND